MADVANKRVGPEAVKAWSNGAAPWCADCDHPEACDCELHWLRAALQSAVDEHSRLAAQNGVLRRLWQGATRRAELAEAECKALLSEPTRHHDDCARVQGPGDCDCAALSRALRIEAKRLRGPTLRFEPNTEAGDGSCYCNGCDEERDEPHSWEDCVAGLRAERGALADASIAHIKLFGDAIDIVKYPLGRTPRWLLRYDERGTARGPLNYIYRESFDSYDDARCVTRMLSLLPRSDVERLIRETWSVAEVSHGVV